MIRQVSGTVYPMADPDLQAVMTGLQEVLPVLDQAGILLQDEASQRRPTDTKGWSNTWSGRPKVPAPTPTSTFLMLDLDCSAPARPLNFAAAPREHQEYDQEVDDNRTYVCLGLVRGYRRLQTRIMHMFPAKRYGISEV